MPADAAYADALDLLARTRFVALTGAGLSTDSGIPDYRGPRPTGVAPPRLPMSYQDFVASAAQQQRYWARAYLGWTRMGTAEPNQGHRALAVLGGPGGNLTTLLTQNVDGLHEAAGQPHLIALHGRIADVVCLDCRAVTSRWELQSRLRRLNRGYAERQPRLEDRPDGDVALEQTTDFVVAGCTSCGGRLKPDVVFFGENVPRERVANAQAAVAEAEALLVAGSSLSVMSGLRFVRQASRAGTPVVICNRGQTRGDEFATHRVHAGCSEFLADLGAQAGRILRPA